MREDQGATLIAGVGIGLVVLVAVTVFLALYVFYSFCFKRICEKCGTRPGALIWIPIARYIPLLELAKMPVWLIILLLIPLVNFVVFLILWFKICEVRGKSGWLVILFFFPLINLVVIPYLAFSE